MTLSNYRCESCPLQALRAVEEACNEPVEVHRVTTQKFTGASTCKEATIVPQVFDEVSPTHAPVYGSALSCQPCPPREDTHGFALCASPYCPCREEAANRGLSVQYVGSFNHPNPPGFEFLEWSVWYLTLQARAKVTAAQAVQAQLNGANGEVTGLDDMSSKQEKKRKTKKKTKEQKKATKVKRKVQLQEQAVILRGLPNKELGPLRGRPIIVGRGDYGLGGSVGAKIGGWLGDKAEAFFRKIFGSGDYRTTGRVRHNRIMGAVEPGMPTPTMAGDERESWFVMTETLGQIDMTHGFKLHRYPIDVSNPITFPWLSRIALNYTEVLYDAVVFWWETQTSDTAITTPGLGKIAGGVSYDADAVPPTTVEEIENSMFGVSVKPSLGLAVVVECSQQMTTLRNYKIAQPDTVREDPSFYQLGVVNFATAGAPADYSGAGTIKISYRVRLSKPTSHGVGGYGLMAQLDLTNPSAGGGFSPDYPAFSINTLGVEVGDGANDSSYVSFPYNLAAGTVILMVHQVEGASTAGVYQQTWTGSNGLSPANIFVDNSVMYNTTNVLAYPRSSVTMTYIVQVVAMVYDGTGTSLLRPKLKGTAGGYPGTANGTATFTLLNPNIVPTFMMSQRKKMSRLIQAHVERNAEDRDYVAFRKAWVESLRRPVECKGPVCPDSDDDDVAHPATTDCHRERVRIVTPVDQTDSGFDLVQQTTRNRRMHSEHGNTQDGFTFYDAGGVTVSVSTRVESELEVSLSTAGYRRPGMCPVELHGYKIPGGPTQNLGILMRSDGLEHSRQALKHASRGTTLECKWLQDFAKSGEYVPLTDDTIVAADSLKLPVLTGRIMTFQSTINGNQGSFTNSDDVDPDRGEEYSRWYVDLARRRRQAALLVVGIFTPTISPTVLEWEHPPFTPSVAQVLGESQNQCTTLNGNNGSVTNLDDVAVECFLGVGCKFGDHFHSPQSKSASSMAVGRLIKQGKMRKRKRYIRCKLRTVAECGITEHFHSGEAGDVIDEYEDYVEEPTRDRPVIVSVGEVKSQGGRLFSASGVVRQSQVADLYLGPNAFVEPSRYDGPRNLQPGSPLSRPATPLPASPISPPKRCPFDRDHRPHSPPPLDLKCASDDVRPGPPETSETTEDEGDEGDEGDSLDFVLNDPYTEARLARVDAVNPRDIDAQIGPLAVVEEHYNPWVVPEDVMRTRRVFLYTRFVEGNLRVNRFWTRVADYLLKRLPFVRHRNVLRLNRTGEQTYKEQVDVKSVRALSFTPIWGERPFRVSDQKREGEADLLSNTFTERMEVHVYVRMLERLEEPQWRMEQRRWLAADGSISSANYSAVVESVVKMDEYMQWIRNRRIFVITVLHFVQQKVCDMMLAHSSLPSKCDVVFQPTVPSMDNQMTGDHSVSAPSSAM